MKLEDLDKFIYEQDLLRDVEEKAGIYAITIDKRVVYVGQNKNIYQRCRSHIYNIFNAMYNKEKKYQLLLSAWLGGHRIDCFQLEYCDIDQLKEKENEWKHGTFDHHNRFILRHVCSRMCDLCK